MVCAMFDGLLFFVKQKTAYELRISDWSADVCSSELGGHAIDKMTVEDLSPAIVRRFLYYVELDRHCSGATRNLRLSAIHSLARFIGMHSPVHLSWCSEVRSIPFKKTTKTLVRSEERRVGKECVSKWRSRG